MFIESVSVVRVDDHGGLVCGNNEAGQYLVCSAPIAASYGRSARAIQTGPESLRRRCHSFCWQNHFYLGLSLIF